jgi:MoaA/NifB/PqqE/SkfB family radical SAM enzyme
MLEVILLKVMLEKLLEETKVLSVTTEFYDYQVEIGWDITMRCNYSCSYCESYNNNQPTYFKDIKIYEKALNYLKN